MIVIGVVGLIVGIVAAAPRSRSRRRVAGLVAGVVDRCDLRDDPWLPGRSGIGIAVGYAMWIAFMVADVARTAYDIDELKARFTPTQTIETSKETLAWLQSKMPPGTGS
jgi:hypothetical protein